MKSDFVDRVDVLAELLLETGSLTFRSTDLHCLTAWFGSERCSGWEKVCKNRFETSTISLTFRLSRDCWWSAWAARKASEEGWWLGPWYLDPTFQLKSVLFLQTHS